jgi:hypothetical protein
VTPRRLAVPRRYPDRSEPYRPTAWHWALCYALYLVVLIACFEGFWLWRVTIERVLGIVLWRHDWFETTYLASMVAVGVVLFSVVVGGESHLRGSLPSSYYPPGSYTRRVLWRFLHVALIVVVVVGGAVAVQEWAFRSLT